MTVKDLKANNPIELVWLWFRPRRKDNLLSERNEAHSVKAHVKRQDGRLQAYGWSLPSRQPGTGPLTSPGVQTTPTHSGSAVKGPAAVGVPVPVYCRPLEDQEPGMKVKFNEIRPNYNPLSLPYLNLRFPQLTASWLTFRYGALLELT